MAGSREMLKLDQGWRYRSIADGDSRCLEWQPARPLPTSIYLDLLAGHHIPDPFQGKNEEMVQWVGERSWVYENTFSIPKLWMAGVNRRVVLVFEGLDTFATVRLDGKTILESKNMFVAHRVDITEQVHAMPQNAPHSVQITFHAVEARGEEEVRKHPEHNWLTFSSGVTRLAVRKAQYHFGWDWGPKLLDCGPWRPIYLETYESRIIDTYIRQNIAPDYSQAEMDIWAEVEGEATHAKVEVEIDGSCIGSQVVEVYAQRCHARILVRDPKLWWPFTLGKQPLYKATVALIAKSTDSTVILDRSEKTFGIRKVELVQKPLEAQSGSSFYFAVNGVPIFAAGSCWIPPDSFLPRMTEQRYHDWIALARASNQVMIRVWGGGIYEHDAFYEACDQQGILVWQDFMFACGIFPAYPDFQASVITEITQNIKRLRHHPCLVLWCGNNEDYIIPLFSGDEYDPEEQNLDKVLQSRFPARLFYEHIFPETCRSLVPDTPYWPGSPFGGEMVNSADEGDVHQWHVWHLEKQPYQKYPELSGRFISEFGMQAAPSWVTSVQFFPAGDLPEKINCTGEEHMTWHNKCIGGAETLREYCTSNIVFAEESLRGYIYGTQLIQSEAVSSAYRAWRRLWKGSGREYCAGALVWQLNDCWPVTSWAIADCHLNPKMAFWAVKRENLPITAGLERTITQHGLVHLEAWACNMKLHHIVVDAEIKAWNVQTGQHVWSASICTARRLESNQATELATLDVQESQLCQNCTEGASGTRNIVFAIYISSAKTAKPSRLIARHVNFHEPLKDVSLQSDPDNLSIKILWTRADNPKTFIELQSKVPMKGVFLEVLNNPDAVLEDNCVDLVPGETWKIGATGLQIDNQRVTVNWLSEKGWQSQVRDIPPHRGFKV